MVVATTNHHHHSSHPKALLRGSMALAIVLLSYGSVWSHFATTRQNVWKMLHDGDNVAVETKKNDTTYNSSSSAKIFTVPMTKNKMNHSNHKVDLPGNKDRLETSLSSQHELNTTHQIRGNNNQRQPPTAWICITGVLGDLELANKVEMLLKPFWKSQYRVRLGLVLQDDPRDTVVLANREPYSFAHPHFYWHGRYVPKAQATLSNLTQPLQQLFEAPFGPDPPLSLRPIDYLRNSTLHRRGEFRNATSIRSYLQSQQQQQGVLDDDTHAVHVEIYLPPISLPMNLGLIKAFTLNEGFGNTSHIRKDGFDRIAWLAMNHVRYLHALNHKCWHGWLRKEEALRTERTNEDLVLRVGDDAMFSQPVDPMRLMARAVPNQSSATIPPQVLSVPCTTARGYQHDQMDVLAASMAQQYFTEPWRQFYNPLMFRNNNTAITNMPAFLKHVHHHLGGNDTDTGTRRESFLPFSFPLSYKDIVNESNALMANAGDPNTTIGQMDEENKNNRTKTALICITGQLQRLEMDRKLTTLIRPLEQDGFSVDLAFVLSSGAARVQQKRASRYSQLQNDIGVTTFGNETDLRVFVAQHNLSVISSQQNDNRWTYIPNPNLPSNSDYMLRQVRGPGFGNKAYATQDKNGIEELLNQVHSNMKMFESYTHCWDHVKRAHKQAYYDLYIRIRDDCAFTDPIRPLFYKDVAPKTVVAPHWKNNGGFNDRMALVGNSAAVCFFNLPFRRLFDGEEYLHPAALNTESYLKDVYDRRNVCGLQKIISPWLIPQKMHLGHFLDGQYEAAELRKQLAAKTA